MRRGEPSQQSRRSKIVTTMIALFCVALQFGRRLDLAALATVIFLVTVVIVDRPAMRRLMMPKFWGITIVFALASGLFLGPRDIDLLGLRLSGQGLEAGALMVFRGLFIFGLVSWVSRAINGSALTRVFARIGLGNLGIAVGSAFGVLPALRDRLRDRHAEKKQEGRRLAYFRGLVVDILKETITLSQRMTDELSDRASYVIVTGPKGAGKSTTLRAFAGGLAASGFEVGGVIQLAIEEEGRRIGYELLDVATEERRPFAQRKQEGRGFDFDEDGWAWAATRLQEAQAHRQILFVDELGWLEAEGGGHMKTLLELCERPGRASLLIAAVRQDVVPTIIEQLGEPTVVLEAPLDAEARQEKLQFCEVLARGAA